MSTRNLLSRNASTLTTASTRVRRRREGLPAHMPSARIPYMTNILRFTLRPGMDVGKTTMVSYFGILLYGTFYKSNVFSNAIRTGYLAVSQNPVLVVLGTKNSTIGMLLGMGYGRVCVLFLVGADLRLLNSGASSTSSIATPVSCSFCAATSTPLATICLSQAPCRTGGCAGTRDTESPWEGRSGVEEESGCCCGCLWAVGVG